MKLERSIKKRCIKRHLDTMQLAEFASGGLTTGSTVEASAEIPPNGGIRFRAKEKKVKSIKSCLKKRNKKRVEQ
jgi:hypothetical protein